MPIKIRPSFFIVVLLSIFFCCCKTKPKPVKENSVNEIIDADLAFSELSEQKGLKNAFIDYIDNEGILLRPRHLPVKGADAIDYLSQINDTLYTLNWIPEGADISASGELGFTYGTYTLQAKDTILKGTYVRIWKKQADGNWKFIMNSTNEAITKQETGDSQ